MRADVLPPPVTVLLVLLVSLCCVRPVVAKDSQMSTDVVVFPDSRNQDPQTPPSAGSGPDVQKPSNASSAICSQTGCSCENRVATCRCQRKVLHLSSDQFKGDDIVELDVTGVSRACLRVTVKSNTFHRSSVKRVKMEGLGKVMLEENSFRIEPGRKQFTVAFRNIEELVTLSHSFSGSISNITFVNATTSLPDKTFVDTAGRSTVITFQDSILNRISGQAFAGARLKQLEFRGCTINGTLPPSALRPQSLSVLRLADSVLVGLQPAALDVSVRSLDVRRCRFGALAAGALAVQWAGKAWLHNNTFEDVSSGAFGRLRPIRDIARLEFHDNLLLQPDPGALRFSDDLSNDQLTVRRLQTQQSCRCHLYDWVRLMGGTGAPGWLVEHLAAAVRCHTADTPQTVFLSFMRRECHPDETPPEPQTGWKRYIVGAAVAAALVAVLCAVSCLAVWQQSRRRRQRHRDRAAAADALRHRPHKLNNANLYTDNPIDVGSGGGGWDEPPESPRRPLVVAVPDVKTYTETEVHVVLETLESMEPTVLPRAPSTDTLQRLREGPCRPAAGSSLDASESQLSACRKSCPL